METITSNAHQRLLSVMEAFYTIQGEGFYQGHAAYFIRLGGCDVGCVWCDVKESWDAKNHPQKTVTEIAAAALRAVSGQPKSVIAVITGGEPLLYNLDELTKALHGAGFQINMETSGSRPLSGKFDWICVSPKKFKAPLPEVVAQADELKIIIYNKFDFDWAEKYAEQTSPDCQLYLQPEWSKEKEMLPLIIDYIKRYPKWKLSLQIHKYINVP